MRGKTSTLVTYWPKWLVLLDGLRGHGPPRLGVLAHSGWAARRKAIGGRGSGWPALHVNFICVCIFWQGLAVRRPAKGWLSERMHMTREAHAQCKAVSTRGPSCRSWKPSCSRLRPKTPSESMISSSHRFKKHRESAGSSRSRASGAAARGSGLRGSPQLLPAPPPPRDAPG